MLISESSDSYSESSDSYSEIEVVKPRRIKSKVVYKTKVSNNLPSQSNNSLKPIYFC